MSATLLFCLGILVKGLLTLQQIEFTLEMMGVLGSGTQGQVKRTDIGISIPKEQNSSCKVDVFETEQTPTLNTSFCHERLISRETTEC